MPPKQSSRHNKSTSNIHKLLISSPKSSPSPRNQHHKSHTRNKTQYSYTQIKPLHADTSKENVTVTVRFRPLSHKEIHQGEEAAWYADGETILRSQYNPSIAYAYDRVFGPTTTTRHVYDVAAQDVIAGAMEGINGTIFAYGVTSSGKTHTMHGDQRSPGIIPLAVKDAFSIIQETPTREFLLRVSYLEIYNEVVHDLLNPAGQNLRIREDIQGMFVEGIKEEVVLSPVHALSLIAAGEAHRHVGSTNFNLLSSRSHTLFTLTIESTPHGENSEGEAVNLSQLNLIDLAGSESSRAETTGIRRKEGSYINKSLLTLGTVISKLTDGRSTHIPYRDSKLTRLLQSSLSGHGRVSLICTVTPSSSNSEETHNTLKFAHRAKHIEIKAAQNKIIDEKSLIKKYQNEISSLKEELEQLKRGIVSAPPPNGIGEDNAVLLQKKLEDGQVKLQSRLEEEEEEKAALLGRIQRLTKLILVSTKATQPSRFVQRPGPWRRHSFGEEELAYLPYKRRDLILDEENNDVYASLEANVEHGDDTFKEGKKGRKHGLLNWFKLRKRDCGSATLTHIDGAKLSGTKSISASSTSQVESISYPTDPRISYSLLTESTPSTDLLLGVGQNDQVRDDYYSARQVPLESLKMEDHIDLLREQHKILSGEVALYSSALKRFYEEAAKNPESEQINVEIQRLNDEIKSKSQQVASLEKQISAAILASCKNINSSELSQPFSELMGKLNEKSFELEVKTADNRIIQEQLNEKIRECEALKETIASLKQEAANSQHDNERRSLERATQIEEFKQTIKELTEAKQQLETHNQKLGEESSYAKGLASAAAVELKALSEEVSKLMNKNEKLASELASLKHSPAQRKSNITSRNAKTGGHVKRHDQGDSQAADIKKELTTSQEREHSYEATLLEKERREAELEKKVEESKQREAHLENELANMWVLVAKLKKTQATDNDDPDSSRESQGVDSLDIWNDSERSLN